MSAREKLAQAMADLGITVESTFVPWSESRNKGNRSGFSYHVTDRSLNWQITVSSTTHNGRALPGKCPILTADYSAGIAHCPSYKGRISADVERALVHETENGTLANPFGHLGIYDRKPILPDPCDVIYSLISDAGALDYGTFEDWAGDLGYDPDSRAAERTYRVCLDIGLKLRAALGDRGLETLRNACEGY